jgi:hypothetical protein
MIRTLISFRLAAYLLLALFACAGLFQITVLLGFVPTEMVWGGRLENEQERTVGSLISLAVLLLMIGVVLCRMGRLGLGTYAVRSQWIAHWGMWAIVLFFTLNTLGNLAAKDLRETLILTPITMVAALLAWRVALGNEPARTK